MDYILRKMMGEIEALKKRLNTHQAEIEALKSNNQQKTKKNNGSKTADNNSDSNVG